MDNHNSCSTCGKLITARNKTGRCRNCLLDERRIVISDSDVEAYLKGETAYSLSKRLGRTPSNIINALKRQGIETRKIENSRFYPNTPIPENCSFDINKLPGNIRVKITFPSNPDACWVWDGGTLVRGYGQVKFRDRVWLVHRAVYTVLVEEIPDSTQLDHLCFNRACVNPSHLRLTTNKQNVEHSQGAQTNNKLGVLGVHYRPDLGKYRVQVRHNNILYHGGYYVTLSEADTSAKALRNELFTHNDLDK